MSIEHARIDRRGLLKMLGALGATATAAGCNVSLGGDVSAQSLSGSKFDKTVALASEGPGGNPQWKAGDSLKFLPPQEIPTRGKAADLVGALPKEKLLGMYEKLNASRRWETVMKDLFLGGKDGLYGYFHSYCGEEAVAVGTIAALAEDDYIASTHRGHGHLIAKGGDLNKMSAEIFFRQAGYNQGYGGSMHIVDMAKGIMGSNGIVGASFYMAAGAAIHGKVRGTKQVGVAFFGDGASASPYYFSAARSCTNYKLPVLFVLENNFQWTGVPMALTVPTKYVSDYTKGLGIPHHTIDGNDVTAVYAAAKEAVEWARAGNGPSVIEAMTFRWYDHSGFSGGKVSQDGAMGLPYRTDDEVKQWISRDPIGRFRGWLLAKGLAQEAELVKIEKDTQAAVDASIEFARNSPEPDPERGVWNAHASGPVPATQFFNRKGLATSTPKTT